MSLTEERAAAAERRAIALQLADAEALVLRARRLLNKAGWKAERAALIELAAETWDKWTPEARTVVVEKAIEIAAVGRTDQKRIDPEEVIMAGSSSPDAQAIRAGIRELLQERPQIAARDAYELLEGRGKPVGTLSTFQSVHICQVRKELGISVPKGTPKTRKAPEERPPAPAAAAKKPPRPEAPQPAPERQEPRQQLRAAAARATAPKAASGAPQLSPYNAFVVRSLAELQGASEEDVLDQIVFAWVSDHSEFVSGAGAGIDAFRRSRTKVA